MNYKRIDRYALSKCGLLMKSVRHGVCVVRSMSMDLYLTSMNGMEMTLTASYTPIKSLIGRCDAVESGDA